MEAPRQTMAKRVRGSTSRPGQRPPLQRQAARATTRPVTPATSSPVAPAAPRSEDLTDAEEARAAQLEAAIVAEEREAEAAKRRARPVTTEAPRVSSLTLSASEEYRYVARDVRRISIVGGTLVAILIGIWSLSHILGMGPL
jgi:hypothetical protein